MTEDRQGDADERQDVDAHPGAQPQERTSTTARRDRYVGLLVALTLACLIGGATWTLHRVQQERAAQEREHAALAAGREAAAAFTTYDYRHIGDDLDRVASRSTGDFREQFTKALGSLTAAIKKAHGISDGEVVQAGLVRSTSTSSVVIAAVDAKISNNSTQGQTVRRYRLEITLNLVAGDWLIADIQPVA